MKETLPLKTFIHAGVKRVTLGSARYMHALANDYKEAIAGHFSVIDEGYPFRDFYRLLSSAIAV